MCTSNVLWSATFSAVRSSPEGEGTIVTLLHSWRYSNCSRVDWSPNFWSYSNCSRVDWSPKPNFRSIVDCTVIFAVTKNWSVVNSTKCLSPYICRIFVVTLWNDSSYTNYQASRPVWYGAEASRSFFISSLPNHIQWASPHHSTTLPAFSVGEEILIRNS